MKDHQKEIEELFDHFEVKKNDLLIHCLVNYVQRSECDARIDVINETLERLEGGKREG